MELENYRKFRRCRIEFPDGVIGIIGQNGAGKSTIIEAISWALYGNKSEIVRDGKEGVKNAAAGPNDDCSVELIFELGGEEYHLRRAMRGKDLKAEAELKVNGLLVASSEKGVTSTIEERLGMDYKAFFISVFARQKDLSALSSLTSAERKKMVLRMLEIDVLDDVVKNIDKDALEVKKTVQFVNEQLMTSDRRSKKDILGEEIKALNADMQKIGKEMEDANSRTVLMEELLAKAKGRKDWAALKEEEYRKQKEVLVKKRAEAESLKKSMNDLSKETALLKEKVASLPDLERKAVEHEELLKVKEQMEGELLIFDEKKALKAELTKVEKELGEISTGLAAKNEQLAPLKRSTEGLRTVERSLEGFEETLRKKRERSSWLDSELKRSNKEIEQLKKKGKEIADLGPDSSCPTCERTLGDHHQHLRDKLEAEVRDKDSNVVSMTAEKKLLDEESERIRKQRSILEERKKKLTDDSHQLTRVQSSIDSLIERQSTLLSERTGLNERLSKYPEVLFDEKQYSELRSRIVSLRPMADRSRALRAEADRVPVLESKMEELRSQTSIKEKELNAVEKDMAAVGYAEGELKLAQTAYEAAFSSREAAINEVSRKAGALDLCSERISDRQRSLIDVIEIETNNRISIRKLEELSVLSKLMKDFRQNVMERIVPTLSELASQLFTEMTDSKYGGIELDENYEIHIYDGGEKYPVGRFSGGESDLANLCLRLAISRVIADRSGNDINFLILDEIFGSQDQVRKRNIMSTLNQLEKQFHQIILITHIDDTKDYMNYVINIKELEDGTSTVML